MYKDKGRKGCDCINFETVIGDADRDHGIFIPGFGVCIKKILLNVTHFSIYLTRGCSVCILFIGLLVLFFKEKHT